jgi:hypothetical protein
MVDVGLPVGRPRVVGRSTEPANPQAVARGEIGMGTIGMKSARPEGINRE